MNRCVDRSQAHHAAGEADATKARADVVPHPDAAPADPLSHGELQEEQRDADQYKQDEIRHQVGSCRQCGGRKCREKPSLFKIVQNEAKIFFFFFPL